MSELHSTTVQMSYWLLCSQKVHRCTFFTIRFCNISYWPCATRPVELGIIRV